MRNETARDTATPAGPADALHAALATLEASGAHRFDPVGFRFIQAMAARSVQQDANVAALVVEKAWQALQAYQCSHSQQRADSAVLVEELASQSPHLSDKLQELLDACAFNEIQRLAARQCKPRTGDTVTALTHQLDTAERCADAGSNPHHTARVHDLKAVLFFRDALREQHADKLVSRALLEAPESAGPLNPQKLALRSLAIMRESSPAYLGHFVSYIETLLWLEQLDHANAPR